MVPDVQVPQSTIDKLFSSILLNGDCWEYTGEVTPRGYGRIAFRRPGCKTGHFSTHRLIYELLKGQIPAGMVIDHLCRNTRCMNPEHLEAVSTLENVHRSLPYKPKTLAKPLTCKRGHSDWYMQYGKFRTCHTCRKERERLYQQERRMKARIA